MPPRLLILGGTGEALALARALAATQPDVEMTTSLAGRTRDPVLPPGKVRIGGFGGVDGLTRYVTAHQIALIINATHPFATEMSGHAVDTHRETGVPLLRLLRPAWAKRPGDSWIPAADARSAAEICRSLGKRVFLSLGARDLEAFVGLPDIHFLVRLVDMPEKMPLARCELITGRGPFSLTDEHALIEQRGIDLIVTKNSGGAATYAKIEVARELGIPVVMIGRPETALRGGDVAESVEAALDWIADHTERSRRTGERNATTGEKA